MNFSLIFDIACVLIFVVSIIFMSGKGIFKCSYKLASIVVSVILVVALTEPCMSYINSTKIGTAIDDAVLKLVVKDDKGDNAADNAEIEKTEATNKEDGVNAFPSFIENAVDDAKEELLAPKISDIVKRLLCAILIFIISKIILGLIFMLIECLFKLPGLKTVNRFLGCVIGLVSGLFIVFLICGALSLDVENAVRIREIMDNTYLVKYFYDNNILMELFLLI